MSTLQVTSIESKTANAPPIIKDSNGVEIGTMCRAWVNFNGTGTVAIRAAFNVSGITDGGTGRYTVNFTTAMPDTNYSVVASHHAVATLSNRNINIFSSSFQTTNTGEIGNIENNAVTDTDVMCVSIFR